MSLRTPRSISTIRASVIALVFMAALLRVPALWPMAGAESAVLPPQPSVWTTQWGGFNHLQRIHAVRADSVWAVGSNLVHFDGRRWIAVDRRDVPGRLRGVDVLPSGDGWAVGRHEAIPIVAGMAQAALHVPDYHFADVAVVDAAHAWAVARASRGSASAILRYRDDGWQPEWRAPDSSIHLSSIWMASADEGWAVGASSAGGTALYYDGTSWTEWPLPVKAGFHEVQGTSADDVWAVGGSFMPARFAEDMNRRVIVHFDGEGWAVVRDEPEPGIRALTLGAGQGYAISEPGEVFELRGGTWASSGVSVPIASMPMHLVQDATGVPGTSQTLVADYSGWIYRLGGHRVTLLHDAATFHAVAMGPDQSGWVLGRSAMAFDGKDWHELPEDSALHAATDIVVDGEVGWAVGREGLLLRYQAGRWVRAVAPIDLDLIRVVVPSPGSVWALGEGLSASDGVTESRVVAYEGDDGWRELWRGPGAAGDLAAVDERALVTTSEGVWKQDGRGWSRIADEPASSVGIGPAGELWVGRQGEIETYDGGTWSPIAWLPPHARISRFHRSAAASWAVADYGFVLAFQGGAWRIVRGDPDFNGIAGQSYRLVDITTAALPDGRTGLWAVGEPDTILHAAEAEVLALPAIPPPPTPDYPTYPDPIWPRAYLPRVDLHPPHHSDTCREVPGAAESVIEEAARETARYYSAGGPAPEPELGELHRLTAAELRDRHGVDLVGVDLGGRRVEERLCVWWAAFRGWFDAEPASSPASPDYRWTRLDLALLGADGRVIYEGFSGRAAESPPTPLPPTPPPTSVRPPTTSP